MENEEAVLLVVCSVGKGETQPNTDQHRKVLGGHFKFDSNSNGGLGTTAYPGKLSFGAVDVRNVGILICHGFLNFCLEVSAAFLCSCCNVNII